MSLTQQKYQRNHTADPRSVFIVVLATLNNFFSKQDRLNFEF